MQMRFTSLSGVGVDYKTLDILKRPVKNLDRGDSHTHDFGGTLEASNSDCFPENYSE
jgi:hypothetical protein